MSRRILATMPAGVTYPNLLVEVSCAFGADLTDIDGSGWTWTDITDDVILEGLEGSPLTTTIGRADESTVTQTSVFKATLDNRSGKYINTGLSTYWPYVRRGTPVRCRVSTNNGSSWTTRFQGSAVGFTPKWPESTGRWATVELEASGPLRVLDQGTLPAKSAMVIGTPGDSTVVGYWPCEDALASITALPLVGSTPGRFRVHDYASNTTVDGVPGAFQAFTEFPSSAPALELRNRGTVFCETDSAAFSASTSTAVFANINAQTAGTRNLFIIYTPNGSNVKSWEVNASNNGALIIRGTSVIPATSVSNTVFSSPAVTFSLEESAVYKVGIRLSQSGSTTTYTMFVQKFGDTSAAFYTGTVSNSGTNACGVDAFLGGGYSDAEGLKISHVTVRNVAMSNLAGDSDWFNGYMGETAQQRITRMANLSDIDVAAQAPPTNETATSIASSMGPQFWDTLSNIAREAELTGLGLLYDGLAPGFTFVSRRFRQVSASGPASLVLDASAGHLVEPFGPIDDDQILFNHYQVSRHGGNQGVEYLDRTGPEGTDIVGDHANSWTVNPEVDEGLIGYAQWGVNVGTVPGFRYPTTSFALHTNPSLIPGWLACLPQSRIDVTNIASVRRQLSPDPIWLLLEGWTETIDAFEWKVQANTSSAEPWNVIRLAAATGSTGDDICHMDTDSSQLNTSATAGATSISVRTNSGPLWVQSSVDADSFPFYITVGGLRVQVTAISGASSPQTFTLASPGLPAAKTGSTTPGAGAPISVWRPPVLGL